MGITEWIVLMILGWATAVAAMDEKHVGGECGYTRYPSLCAETLSAGNGNGNGNEHVDVLSVLVDKTILETKLPIPAKFSYQFGTFATQRTHVATSDHCDELMSMALKRLNQSLSALKQSATKNKHDIQTWLSAVLTYQQTCKDSLGLGLITGELMDQISQKMDHLSQLGSNALALVNRINISSSTSTSSKRRLAAEEQIFPEWVSAGDRKLLQTNTNTNTIKANAVVAKDGTGNYATISEAIRAASGNRFVIYVKSGVYKEKIRTNKDGITLIGDGKYSTLIVADDSVIGGASLLDSATFTITGDGFIARDMGFQNTAGPDGEQAVALSISSDHSVLYRCSIVGYQDTLYALALRQFYRECDIYGTIDFIFGNAAAVFQNCYLVLRRPRDKSYNVILANGRTDPGQTTGFSIQKCTITASSDFSPLKHSYNSYLGRPWKTYSRAVVMETTVDAAINSRGWIEWPGTSTASSALKTLYFAEYANLGPGAATAARVKWPGFHVIAAADALKFTVATFIAGTTWLPSTGVTFVSGLQ